MTRNRPVRLLLAALTAAGALSLAACEEGALEPEGGADAGDTLDGGADDTLDGGVEG